MNDTRDECQYCQEEVLAPSPTGRDDFEFVIFFVMVCLVLASLLWLPQTKILLGLSSSAVEVQRIGSVQRVLYVGSLGYDTQVDTEGRSLLLSGVVDIAKDTPLELHTQDGRTVVCMADTQTCWRLLGH